MPEALAVAAENKTEEWEEVVARNGNEFQKPGKSGSKPVKLPDDIDDQNNVRL